VSLLERGNLDLLSLRALREVAKALDIRLELTPRWRGGELDRLLNARHSALHEQLARMFGRAPGWFIAPEVSFNVYGDRGVIDLLAFHPASRSLLVIELKTEIVDVQELVGTMSRKVRVAQRVALDRGWRAASVSGWIVVAYSTTNRRQIAAHRTMLRAAFGSDGRTMRGWIAAPQGSIAALSMWSPANRGGTGLALAPVKRVSGAIGRPGRA